MISTRQKTLQMLLLIINKLLISVPKRSLITPTKLQSTLKWRISISALNHAILLLMGHRVKLTITSSLPRSWLEKLMLFFNKTNLMSLLLSIRKQCLRIISISLRWHSIKPRIPRRKRRRQHTLILNWQNNIDKKVMSFLKKEVIQKPSRNMMRVWREIQKQRLSSPTDAPPTLSSWSSLVLSRMQRDVLNSIQLSSRLISEKVIATISWKNITKLWSHMMTDSNLTLEMPNLLLQRIKRSWPSNPVWAEEKVMRREPDMLWLIQKYNKSWEIQESNKYSRTCKRTHRVLKVPWATQLSLQWSANWCKQVLLKWHDDQQI